jgi:RNA polymerase-binding transcription factor
MAATKKTTTKEPAKKVATPAKKAPAKAPAARKAAPAPAPAPAPDHADGIPAPRGTTKDGIAYTKDFDVKFLKAQHDSLLSERAALTGQATRLEDEANSLIEDGEMGDVQFDDESGEGDTMVVERERDLALSAQARQTVVEIDAALERMAAGTYGYSIVSGAPIPRERLEAIPWATVLVEEKVGGIGRR